MTEAERIEQLIEQLKKKYSMLTKRIDRIRSTVEYRDIEDKMFEIEEELDTYAERYGRSRDR
jgi:hypothetical protein